jgi:uncharacterized membrane protein YkvI
VTIYPYLFYMNGPLVTFVILLAAATFSVVLGYMLTTVGLSTGATRYEDMALQTYGRKCAKLTSVFMLLLMMGFVTAMVVLVSLQP